MSILESEILLLKSLVVNDTATNGGKFNNLEVITSGVSNNLWPNVFKAERISGSTKYRKNFVKVNNDDDDIFYNPQIWLDIVTEGDDWITFFPGTQVDLQGDINGSEEHYGCAVLFSDVSSGSYTVTVDVENSVLATGNADEIFRDGDVVRITDKLLPSSVTGNENFRTITGTPTVANSTQVTMTFTEALDNDFSAAAGSRVMSIYEPSDIECSWDSWVETCAGTGTYDEGTSGNVVCDAIGTIYETYTLTFTDATHFTCTDSDANVIDTGDTGTDFSPLNSDNSKPLFTIKATGWSGVWASLDTIVFVTHPATLPLWQKRVVPANAGSLAGNKTTLVINGEVI